MRCKKQKMHPDNMQTNFAGLLKRHLVKAECADILKKQNVALFDHPWDTDLICFHLFLLLPYQRGARVK